ncbi:unnamed protein product [Candidula unifasciata]|uniref:Uncharacterized protein n=1 Tax=Candidula unifasciata TaxID=100452 RepID=A0A8S3Z573_9EUPU|nr:unnamed protein product [Candidula unifasciata]
MSSRTQRGGKNSVAFGDGTFAKRRPDLRFIEKLVSGNEGKTRFFSFFPAEKQWLMMNCCLKYVSVVYNTTSSWENFPFRFNFPFKNDEFSFHISVSQMLKCKSLVIEPCAAYICVSERRNENETLH